MKESPKQPKHQQLLDQLMVKLDIYKVVVKDRKAYEPAHQKYSDALSKELALGSELKELQNQLLKSGINYNIPIEEVRSVEALGPKTKPNSGTIRLNYETVTSNADEIMRDGMAVSLGLLAKKLGAGQYGKKIILGHLQQAVDEGKYRVREESMFAFKKKFPVYYPIDQELPFLPSMVSLNEYQTLVNLGRNVVKRIKKKKFTQKEFYKLLRPLGKDVNIDAKKIMMTIPSVLRNYVKTGMLETKDGNLYKKLEFR